MATGRTTFTVDASLQNQPGLHRYRWDMRHPGPWHPNPRRRFRNGPYVSPGAFIIRLYVDDTVLQQPLFLTPDPRILDAGLTLDDLQRQESLALQVVDLLSEAYRLEQSLRSEIENLEKKEKNGSLTPDERSNLDALRKKHSLLVNDEGPYPQNMLISQIQYLYGITADADQLPGRDAYTRYEELKADLERLR